jgi:Xylose isomerase-like TIM barrel.
MLGREIFLMKRKLLTGVFSWFGYIMPFKKRIELIKKAGFDAVSLWWEDEDESNRKDMPKLAREMGLIIDNVHFPYNDCNLLWISEKDVETDIIRKYFLWLEECAENNINLVVMHVENNAPFSPNEKGIENMLKLVDKAKELKLKIALENTRKNEYLDYIFKNINDENLGFCHDTSHDWLSSKGKFDSLKNWGDKLLCTHISDNDGKEDRHFLPAKGVINWDEYVKIFPKNYNGILSLEICATKDEVNSIKPEDFLKIARERIHTIFF